MRTRQWIPVGALLATMIAAVYVVVQMNAQGAALTGDFTKATTAQVKDAQGQIVLEGKFLPSVEEDGGFERRATLTATGADADARGDAEVEFAKVAPTEQEVEFTVENLQANTSFSFVIDGTEIATATTDRRGRADVELNVRMPGRERARSERAYGADAARVVLVVVMQAAVVREVDVIGHVRGLLRRGPVHQVVGKAGVTEVTETLGFEVAVEPREFVARGQEPSADAIQDVLRAEIGC